MFSLGGTLPLSLWMQKLMAIAITGAPGCYSPAPSLPRHGSRRELIKLKGPHGNRAEASREQRCLDPEPPQVLFMMVYGDSISQPCSEFHQVNSLI